MMTPRERFLSATLCQAVDRPPIWLMRQAGRYLPEYRALKEQYDFLTMVQTPRIAAEVTLQPLKRFPLDAAILFSDILVIPEALGQGYHFREGGGIEMDYLLDSPQKLAQLDPGRIDEKLRYVADALDIIRKQLGEQHALLGFAGSPWTLACYMLAGGSSKDFQAVKQIAWDQPALFTGLMEKLSSAIVDYLQMQIDSGVDAIQIFDSWAAICPQHHYWDWSLKWIRKIIQKLDHQVPIILYAKGMGHHMHQLTQTGAEVYSLDWTMDLQQTRQLMECRKAIQGNLDPICLCTTPEITRAQALKVLEQNQSQNGFIFNLGHGMVPSAKINCVEALMEVVTGQKNAI